MKDTVIVVFPEDGSIPRIYHGANPVDFSHKISLVNPEFPKGIPPHYWYKAGSKIGVKPKKDWGTLDDLHLNASRIEKGRIGLRAPLKTWQYAAIGTLIALAGLLGHLL